MTDREPQAHDFSRGSRRPAAKPRPGSRRSFELVRYRASTKTVFSAKNHVVWCPKYRRRVLTGRVEDRLKEIVGEVCAEHRVEVLEIEVVPDHVHLLVEIPPTVALSGFMQVVKGRSSRTPRREFARLRRLPCLWSPSWFVSTVGGAPLDVVRRYVENQRQAA